MTTARVISVSTEDKDLRKFALAIQQLANGRSNATGSVTLAANAASTTVSHINCAAGSTVQLTATTAHAAAELAAGGCYVSAVSKQSFTITHANNAQTDRTFFYVIAG